MTFTTALAQSINIPAVKVLYLAGINNVIDLARKAGITSLQGAGEYGLSLALGAADVRPLEITNAFSIFANGGVYHPAVAILKVTNEAGDVLEEYQDNGTPVLDPGVANDISAMLSNNQARLPSYRVDNPLTFPGYDVAAKTGTTNDYRDAWTIGYTPFISVGVWAGNNDNSPMVKEIAGYIVAPMWHEFMTVVLQRFPREFFGEPTAIPENIPGVLKGEVSAHELLYYIDKDNPLGGRVGRAARDPQYPAWEYGVSSWLSQGFTGQ
jgi:membrane peptidoglycan carboxypeptidase